MRINSIQNYQYSNYSVQNRVQNPYFTGSEKTTKSSSQGIITIEGLYKKFPEHAAEVIKALNENATAVDFIKKYNAHVILTAHKKNNDWRCRLNIFYDNPADSKIKQSWKRNFGTRDYIVLDTIGQTMEKASRALVQCMISEGGKNPFFNGNLESNIKYKEKEIQEALDKKQAKRDAKLAKKQEKQAQKDALTEQQKMLEESIQELNDKVK